MSTDIVLCSRVMYLYRLNHIWIGYRHKLRINTENLFRRLLNYRCLFLDQTDAYIDFYCSDTFLKKY